MLGSLWVPRGKKTPFNNRLIRMERTSWFERLLFNGGERDRIHLIFEEFDAGRPESKP